MEKEEIINRVSIYIINTYNITLEELNNNKKHYIKCILKKVKDNNNQVRILRLKRDKVRNDINDLEVSLIGSQTFDGVVEGKNTGLRKNTVELKYLRKKELKEELGNLLIETQLLEKSLEDNNNLIRDFISLLPNDNQRSVMIMTYVECMTNVEIASTLFYTIENIDILRWRGLKKLESIFKNKNV